MINVVEKYMKNKGISITDISKASGISMSTLSNAFNKPV
ncbi:transcriptional regulator, partial [Lactobacillus sp. UMNPBX4]